MEIRLKNSSGELPELKSARDKKVYFNLIILKFTILLELKLPSWASFFLYIPTFRNRKGVKETSFTFYSAKNYFDTVATKIVKRIKELLNKKTLNKMKTNAISCW